MAAPVITIDINARLAKLEQGLAEANRSLNRFGGSLDTIGRRAKQALGGITVGAVVRQFEQAIKGSIDFADKLNDVSKATQIPARDLGGLAFAGDQAGTSLEGVAKGFRQFNLQLGAARSGNAEAVQTFRDLGFTLEDIQKLTPLAAFAKTADAFRSFEESSDKATLGNRAFKRSYSEIAALLDEGGASILKNVDYWKRYSGVTDDVIQKSDEYNDTLTKLKLLNGAFVRNITADLLPILQTLANHFVAVKEKGDGFAEGADKIARGLGVIAAAGVVVVGVFAALGDRIGAAAASAVEFASLNFKRAAAIEDEFGARQKERVAEYKALVSALLNPQAQPSDAKGGTPAGTRPAPRQPDADVAAGAKKLADARVKAIEAALKSEQDVLKARQGFLDDYYAHDEISLTAFYDARLATIRDGLAAEQKAIGDEIAIRRRELSIPGLKPADREEIQGRINELVARGARVEQEAAFSSIQSETARGRAFKALGDQITEAGIRVRELAGDLAGAARQRFEFENRGALDRIRQARSTGDPEEVRRAEALEILINTQRKYNDAIAQTTELQRDSGLIFDAIGNAQARIAIQVRTGQIGELEGLAKQSEANKARIVELQSIAANMQRVAEATKDPQMLAAVDALRLRIEELGAATDLVGEKFRGIFRDSFADTFADIATGAKSVGDAIRSLEKTIVSSISRIAANNLADAIFGKGGNAIGGNIGSFFANLFGGGGLPAFASGTNYAPGGLALVGERGPEVVALPRASKVIPTSAVRNSGGFGQRIINVHVNVPTGTSRASADQIAAASGRAVSRAMQRNL